jgi:hypothetical protein
MKSITIRAASGPLVRRPTSMARRHTHPQPHVFESWLCFFAIFVTIDRSVNFAKR